VRLLDAKKTAAWRETHRSFSAWLRDEAQARGVQPSVLWRNLGALEYYRSLGPQYDGLALPDVEVAGAAISPQHLELIEKLSQCADRASIRQLLLNALKGQVTRSELQAQWRIYRSMSTKDRATRAATSFRSRLTEAEAVLRFMGASPEWTGFSAPALYRVFVSPALSDVPSPYRIDVVALCRPEPNQAIAVHGVEIKLASLVTKRSNLRDVADELSASRGNFDHCWLAVATEQSLRKQDAHRLLAEIPAQFGLLVISRSRIQVLRSAPRNSRAHAAQLLAEILSAR
jgi:hypothetical protein